MRWQDEEEGRRRMRRRKIVISSFVSYGHGSVDFVLKARHRFRLFKEKVSKLKLMKFRYDKVL